MTQILFVQGGGKGAHDEWDDKLVASLSGELGDGYQIRYPRMPREDDPSYHRWRPALLKEIAVLDSDSVLVAHSIGATMVLALLAEAELPGTLNGAFLIAAPFVGPGGWPSDEIDPMTDLGRRLPKSLPLCFYQGDADETAPPGHLQLYAEAVPQAKARLLPGRDHQLGNDLTEVAADIRRLMN